MAARLRSSLALALVALAALAAVPTGQTQDVISGGLGKGRSVSVTPMRTAAMPNRRQLQATIKASPSSAIKYHGGRVATAPIIVNIIWYGPEWTSAQTSIILDFFNSIFTSTHSEIPNPQLRIWWYTNRQYYNSKGATVTGWIKQGVQYNDTGSFGLTNVNPQAILTDALNRGVIKPDTNALNLILTSPSVTVLDPLAGTFCKDFCGFHSNMLYNGVDVVFSHVGNADTQCPGECSLAYTSAPSPNGDKGVDAMVSLLGSQLSAVATDPDLNGWYDKNGLESGDLCQYTYGKILTDSNGAAYNTNGLYGRKYLIQQVYSLLKTVCTMG
eukprot:SM000021S06531  [mRNA]  locus=s21:1133746:1136417:- [translate_table: standard]